ncbi:MAG TPA: hypothetical protein VFC26_12430, partial [Verrucomicrobiae bacterium]|nr:hypothetical protein [Verrucomicrobiae bacterium]
MSSRSWSKSHQWSAIALILLGLLGPARADDNVTLLGGSIPCGYDISPKEWGHYYGPATNSFDVSALGICSWTATTSDPWIHLIQSSGSGNGKVIYWIEFNNSGSPPGWGDRTGTIHVAGKTFYVYQGPGDLIFAPYHDPCPTITPSNRNHSSSAQTGSIAVDCGWIVNWTATNNGNTWITITSDPRQTGTGVVTYAISQNAAVGSRTGKININCT